MERRGLANAAKAYLMIVNVVLALMAVCSVVYGFARDSDMTTQTIGAMITLCCCILGFNAARRESPQLLKTYGAIMIVLLILKCILVGILAASASNLTALTNRSLMSNERREQMKNALSSFFTVLWVMISIELVLAIVLVIAAFYFAAIIEREERMEELRSIDTCDNSKI